MQLRGALDQPDRAEEAVRHAITAHEFNFHPGRLHAPGICFAFVAQHIVPREASPWGRKGASNSAVIPSAGGNLCKSSASSGERRGSSRSWGSGVCRSRCHSTSRLGRIVGHASSVTYSLVYDTGWLSKDARKGGFSRARFQVIVRRALMCDNC